MHLIWSRPALADLRAIDRWLMDHATAAIAARTLGQIRSRADLLQSFPFAGRGYRDFRIALVRSTPFLILYRVGEDAVEVLAIRHERQDWQ